MSKIFRLYKNGSSTYTDWNSSQSFPYNSTNRDTIEDPNGASARHEITSIPSPFARIDLVKSAFKEVCRSGNLDGNTIFHKMVSDALDVGEIFFNIDKFSDKIEILNWNPGTMIPSLVNSNNAGHRYFGDALDKYMKSDGATYNFGHLNNIYLLNYISGPNPLNIIGATSPATLFFSSANDLSYVKNICFGLDIPFDGIFQPLYKRDFEFVKYFFALKNANGNFVRFFPEIDNYLNKTYSAISDPVKRQELRNVSMDKLQLSPISVYNGGQLNQVEVLGITLQQKGRPNPGPTSGFAMNSTMVPIANIPLVLPVVSGGVYSNLKYTTDSWGNDNKAQYFDSVTDINSRRLPFDGQEYPYLTISDFLEDTIIKVPHKLNVRNYFDGNVNDIRDYSYLLPIKPLFFEYFTTEELRGVMPDRKPMVEIFNRASGVTVTLRIPIRGSIDISYIEYSRTYYEDTIADAANNKGAVVKFEFTGFVMPQIRFTEAKDAIYNVSSIQPQSDGIKFEFYSINDGRYIQSQHTCRDKNGMFRIDNYLIEGSNFNYIRVFQNQTSGILLPIFKEQRNIEQFEFAIDLGTSNTHIEYRKTRRDGTSVLSEAFSFDSNDRQLCEIFVGETDLRAQTELIEKDFIPAKLGNGDFRFPTRTVLSSARTINWQNNIEPFTLVNLPFTYDKRGDLEYNDYLCNIKWGSRNREMEAYVRCLMLIIRNKVLMNDGNLEATKITWFYPISMSPNRLRRLRDAWDDAFHKYFGVGTTRCMTESVAPINYFFNTRPTTQKFVNIDIGGGTTDIAFATGNRIDYVTSFHFASNTLFEDSLSDSTENGIVDWHKNRFLELFEDSNAHELEVAYTSSNNRNPANMASFLFGLKDNSVLRNAGISDKEFDFNGVLKEDEDFKIVFVVFYTSIIYHIAQIVKALRLEVPRHISFSGNGSKVVNIIADEKTLVKYTKLVFEKVLGRPYGNTLEFLGIGNESNSKESTCKGGIIGVSDDNDISAVVLKSDCSGIVTSSDTYASLNDGIKRDTVGEVSRFFDFALTDMDREFNFNSNFGVTRHSLDIAKEAVDEMKNTDFMTFLGRGIDQHMLDINNPNEPIRESFFFYPIKGAIQTISSRIYNSLNE